LDISIPLVAASAGGGSGDARSGVGGELVTGRHRLASSVSNSRLAHSQPPASSPASVSLRMARPRALLAADAAGDDAASVRGGERAVSVAGTPSSSNEALAGLLPIAPGFVIDAPALALAALYGALIAVSFAAPPLRYCTDNAAMIALAGAERLLLGLTDPLDVAARPRWPLDEAMAASNPIHKPSRKGAKA
jgi:hypothetical protein